MTPAVKERLDFSGIDFLDEDDICHIYDPMASEPGRGLCGSKYDCPAEGSTRTRYEGQKQCPDCGRTVCPECASQSDPR